MKESFLLFCLAFLASAVAVPPSSSGSYIVTFKNDLTSRDADSHFAHVHALHARSVASRSLTGPLPRGITQNFTLGSFRAYTGSFAASVVSELKRSPEVAHVEEDGLIEAPEWGFREAPPGDAAEPTPGTVRRRDGGGKETQPGAPWGLARISHETPPSETSYVYERAGSGAGMHAYIIDSGVKKDHDDFGGRVSVTTNLHPDEPDADSTGHGTAVAGVLGGRTYGVLKDVDMVSVKVLGADRWYPVSRLLGAIKWVDVHIETNGRRATSVVNISLIGSREKPFKAVEAYLDALRDKGTLVVVCASNDKKSLQLNIPATAKSVLTVGATTRDDKLQEKTNRGPFVDLYAPGEDIRTTMNGGGVGLFWGSSFAAPHVAGLALYFMQQLPERLARSPDAIKKLIINTSLKKKIKNCPVGTWNRIAYNHADKDGPIPFNVREPTE